MLGVSCVGAGKTHQLASHKDMSSIPMFKSGARGDSSIGKSTCHANVWTRVQIPGHTQKLGGCGGSPIVLEHGKQRLELSEQAG